ncbi:MmcQ/YjbR family DNA-binding protein [soil metagenome]
MTHDEVDALILSLPETYLGSAYGQPAYRTAGKFLTRLRSEDDSLVIHLDSFDERDLLIEMDPDGFFFTDHYRNHTMVLARIGGVDPTWLRTMMVRRWCKVASKTLQKAHPALTAARPGT